MFMSSVKSPAPKAMRLTRVPAAVMARMLAIPLRRLDDGDDIECADRQAPLLLEVRNHPVDGPDLVGRLEFRQDDAVDTSLHDGDDVAIAELGGSGVDADIAKTRAGALASCDDDGARRLLLRDRAGILEVEDRCVGIERERLLDAPRVIAGREQERAIDGHRALLCGVLPSKLTFALLTLLQMIPGSQSRPPWPMDSDL